MQFNQSHYQVIDFEKNNKQKVPYVQYVFFFNFKVK